MRKKKKDWKLKVEAGEDITPFLIHYIKYRAHLFCNSNEKYYIHDFYGKLSN